MDAPCHPSVKPTISMSPSFTKGAVKCLCKQHGSVITFTFVHHIKQGRKEQMTTSIRRLTSNKQMDTSRDNTQAPAIDRLNY